MLNNLGIAPFLIPNTLDYKAYDYLISKVEFCGLVLTGGNDLSSIRLGSNVSLERDMTENKLINHCIQNDLPILGVCRGMQVLVEYFGGTLIKVPNHVANRHIVDVYEPICSSFEANSFHTISPNPDTLPNCLKVTAISRDGQIEALRHTSLPVQGVMWHPERNSAIHQYDIDLFKKVFNL